MKEDISKSKFYAQQAFNEVRYMIGTTHLNLNESFEEIVKKLAATLEANYNISTKVYIGSTKIQHLSENVQIELIRILQEALSPAGITGAVLILGAAAVSELEFSRRR